MQVLANRKTQGTVQGQVSMNGKVVPLGAITDVSAYVEQQDSHLSLQTVYEAVFFSARVRLDRDLSEEACDKIVMDTLHQLEMAHLRDRLVGDPGRGGISFGQRKLLSIAVELVTNPSIMFLDEPTTGVDSSSALVIAEAILDVSATGRTGRSIPGKKLLGAGASGLLSSSS